MYHVGCPHCGKQIQLARALHMPVTTNCPHCGGTVHLRPQRVVATAPTPPASKRRPRPPAVPALPLFLGGIAVVAGLVLMLVLLLIRGSGSSGQPEVVAGQAKKQPAAEAPVKPPQPTVRWPEFNAANFPELPAQIIAPAGPLNLQWGFEPGLQLLYRAKITSQAALSPIDLGAKAKQVLQFFEEDELTLSLECLRVDAGLATLAGEIQQLRGRMQAPTGRLEYDSRDGTGFLPADSPYAKLVRRRWHLIVANDTGQILRAEWPDGDLIEGQALRTVLSITPVLQLPSRPEVNRDVTGATLDGRTLHVRLLGQDQATGMLVFVFLLEARPGTDAPQERRLVLFDAHSGLAARMTFAYERQRGTGLPRVGSFRPTLKTTGVIELVR